MADPEKSRTLLRNARREIIVTLVLWTIAMTWTVGYCYLRGYLHAPDQDLVEPVDAGPAQPHYNSPTERWVVRSGLAVRRSGEDLTLIWGMPDWVFWGIFVPWVLCVGCTMLYSTWGMPDDDLGEEMKGADDGP